MPCCGRLNPYALADLAEPNSPTLGAYRQQIELSRALDGKGHDPASARPRALGFPKGHARLSACGAAAGSTGTNRARKNPNRHCLLQRREAQRVLVICPASVRIQWGERIREWSTIPNVKISVMLRVKDGIHPTAHYQVISYDAARNPAIIRAISKYKWDVLICDEAHKMKNIEALTTRAIIGNSRGEYQHGEIKVPAIAKHCREHLALTGTLLLNRPSEAYVLFRFFDWEAIDFASEDKFKERYNRQADMKTIEGKRFKLESTSLENELQNRLRVNVMARHEKKDVLKFMKPPRFSIVRCEETGTVKGALDAEGLLGLDIEEIQTTKDFEILGHIAEVRRLMGIALAPQIAEYAADFLDGSDEKLCIFAWHLEVLDIFEKNWRGSASFGSTGENRRTHVKKRLTIFVERRAYACLHRQYPSSGHRLGWAAKGLFPVLFGRARLGAGAK
jgi:superfamily II DNA or RNA helicase